MFGRYTGGEYDLAASYVIGDRATDILLARNLGAQGILLAPRRRAADAGGSRRRRRLCAGHRLVERNRRIHPPRRTPGRNPARDPRDADHRPPRPRRPRGFQRPNLHGPALSGPHARADRPPRRRRAGRRRAGRSGHRRTPHDGGRGHHAGRGRRPRAGREGRDRPLRLRPADGRLPGADAARLRGRIDFEWDASFRRERVGDVPTEMFRHFFHSFACAARCNLQISARGDNDHHKAEAVFKAFARALRMAVAHIPFDYTVPSSKGVL